MDKQGPYIEHQCGLVTWATGDLLLGKKSEPESLAQSEFVLVRHSVKKIIWARLKSLAFLKGMTLSDFLESHYEKIIEDEMKSLGSAYNLYEKS